LYNEAKNQWAALCAAHEMASKIPGFVALFLVRGKPPNTETSRFMPPLAAPRRRRRQSAPVDRFGIHPITSNSKRKTQSLKLKLRNCFAIIIIV